MGIHGHAVDVPDVAVHGAQGSDGWPATTLALPGTYPSRALSHTRAQRPEAGPLGPGRWDQHNHHIDTGKDYTGYKQHIQALPDTNNELLLGSKMVLGHATSTPNSMIFYLQNISSEHTECPPQEQTFIKVKLAMGHTKDFQVWLLPPNS